MWDFNQVIFQGRITENAKLRETADGIKYCRFTVANNTPKKNYDGSVSEHTNYLNLVIFDSFAVRNEQKVFKGRRVMIVGKIIQNRKKCEEMKIKVERILFEPLTKEERKIKNISYSFEKEEVPSVVEEIL